MTVELYQNISLISFVLAGILFLIAVVLFIRLRIPAIIGNLNGTAQRKAIASIQEQTAQTRSNHIKSNYKKSNKNQVTEEILNSSVQEKPKKKELSAGSTTVLQNETVSLEQIKSDFSGTMVLNEEIQKDVNNQTQSEIILSPEQEGLIILNSILLISTDEVIR